MKKCILSSDVCEMQSGMLFAFIIVTEYLHRNHRLNNEVTNINVSKLIIVS